MSEHVRFLPLGAIIHEFNVGGRNIVLNFHTADQYNRFNEPFFGETIGRVANRIKGARIDNLNGKSYDLAKNNGPNSLHGGAQGWGKKTFEGPREVERNGKAAKLFTYLSKDGEENYPGTVELRVWYTQYSEQTAHGDVLVLEVEYEAELVGEEDTAETAVAVTNHSYFNLGDTSSIEGTQVTLSTNLHQTVDDTDIPLGPIVAFPDIRAHDAFTLGPQEPDIDHCFIMNDKPKSVPTDTRSSSLQLLAAFNHPATKIHLQVWSTEPAFQFYTGKYIDVPEVDGIPARKLRAGFAIEPSRYINAVNVDDWKGMVVLKRGEKFGSRNVYKAWTT